MTLRWCSDAAVLIPDVVRVPSPWASTATGATQTPATAGASELALLNGSRRLSSTPSVQGDYEAPQDTFSAACAAGINVNLEVAVGMQAGTPVKFWDLKNIMLSKS